MTAPVRPPRQEGLHTLAPELARIVDALARIQEERDYLASLDARKRAEPPPRGRADGRP